jgi:hypothetical protein
MRKKGTNEERFKRVKESNSKNDFSPGAQLGASDSVAILQLVTKYQLLYCYSLLPFKH